MFKSCNISDTNMSDTNIYICDYRIVLRIPLLIATELFLNKNNICVDNMIRHSM